VHVSRRRFLGSLAAAGAGLAGLPRRLGAASAFRNLSLQHTHTGERLDVAYFADGGYVGDALVAVNHLLRDWRTEDVFPIEPGLLDLLHRLHAATGTQAPFQVISGYRSPATNAMLRKRSRGVAAGSLHMKGMAIDIRVPGIPLRTLWRSALRLEAGGVGFYPASNFVHVDIGRVRTW
jgi:uncharacterized protein YcbK (DUF882 family)